MNKINTKKELAQVRFGRYNHNEQKKILKSLLRQAKEIRKSVTQLSHVF